MRELVGQVLDSGRISYGPMSKQFEKEFAKLHDCKYAILSNSGTSSLHVALQAMKEIHLWDRGAQVIVPATTFVATANIVRHCGLRPVFVDVDPVTYNIDCNLVADAVTEDTVAIIPVHLFGQPADMTALRRTAPIGGKIKIIEDSCETMFVSHNGCKVGSMGDIGCFSTYVAHLIVTGVGGIATTNQPEYAAKMRSLVNHGLRIEYLNPDDNFSPQPMIGRRFIFDSVGHSYRITEMEAGIGIAQLEEYDWILRVRRRNASHLTAGIEIINKTYNRQVLRTPTVMPENGHAWMMYPIVLVGADKTPLVSYLNDWGIETRDMLPILHQPIYDYLSPDDFPVSAEILKSGFYVGCHQDLEPSDIQYIVDRLHEWVNRMETGWYD